MSSGSTWWKRNGRHEVGTEDRRVLVTDGVAGPVHEPRQEVGDDVAADGGQGDAIHPPTLWVAATMRKAIQARATRTRTRWLRFRAPDGRARRAAGSGVSLVHDEGLSYRRVRLRADPTQERLGRGGWGRPGGTARSPPSRRPARRRRSGAPRSGARGPSPPGGMPDEDVVRVVVADAGGCRRSSGWRSARPASPTRRRWRPAGSRR